MRHPYSFNISRKNVWQLFILYCCALFYTVFLTPNRYRGDESVRLNLVPLIKTFEAFYEQGTEYFWPYYIGYWGNIFGNMILFMPFGFLYKCLCPQKKGSAVISYGALVSIGIELLQLILRIGVCDIDDVIFNVAGVVGGVCVYRFAKKKWPQLFAML